MSDVVINDRQLVTFAIFAYNQERYIREAVEGAFSQTYEPLEIILSDDCSSDDTFKIMQKMAQDYSGPHTVKVRVNPRNLGVLGHVLVVAQESIGNYLVVGAGDDVSLPQRVSQLVPLFVSEKVAAVWSQDLIINDLGDLYNYDESRIERRRRWHRSSKSWILGATAAYRMSFLRMLSVPNEKIFMEDVVFEDVLSALGGLSTYTETPLIKYRYHENNLSVKNINGVKAIELTNRYSQRWRRVCGSKDYAISELSKLQFQGLKLKKSATKRVKISRSYFQILSEWEAISLLGRIYFIYLSWRLGKLKAGMRRVFGW